MRSLVITLLLTICLLIFDMAQAKGRRIVNFKPCSRRIMTGTPYLPRGCSMVLSRRIRVYGCQGYCASETISMTNRKELSKRCTCCMPTGYRRTMHLMVCNGRGGGRHRRIYHRIPVVTATGCKCRKCPL